jgi:transposase
MADATTDLAGLRAQLTALLAENRDEEVVAAVVDIVAKLTADNRKLAEQLATFMRGRAHGGSERLSTAQLMMFMLQVDSPSATGVGAPAQSEDEAEGTADADLEPTGGEEDSGDAAGDTSASDTGRPSRKRKQVRVVGVIDHSQVTSEPPDTDKVCPDCGEAKAPAGAKTRLLVEVIPAQFRIVEHTRAQYACRRCDDPHMVIGAPAATPLESGILTTSLLVDFLCRKHADHEPVNRIAQTYERMGLEVPLGTLYGWVPVGADLLQPIARRIVANAIAAAVLQVDDTGITVLDEDSEKGRRRGHLWTLLGDATWAGFQFTPDWKAERVEKFLGVRQGWMQGDAYAGYDRFYGRDRAVEVGCWSHARRYFVKALDVGDARAARPLEILQRLFRVERRAEEKGYNDARRLLLRQEKSRPLLNELGVWVDQVHATTPPDTPLGRAITYITNQWQALIRFLEDGRLRLTNNDAERQLRPIALGRNNWLFTGSDAGGERLATLYTCVATCKLASIDPRTWMSDVIDKLVQDWPASRLDELLPPMWAAAQKALEQNRADQVA